MTTPRHVTSALGALMSFRAGSVRRGRWRQRIGLEALLTSVREVRCLELPPSMSSGLGACLLGARHDGPHRAYASGGGVVEWGVGPLPNSLLGDAFRAGYGDGWQAR